MYHGGDFDLAGFAVGAMERGDGAPARRRRRRSPARPRLLAASTRTASASSAASSSTAGLAWDAPCPFGDGTLGEALLTPTRLYVRPALAAMRAGGVHALAHITGGGLTENLPRVLPKDLGAEIDLDAWTLPPVFAWLRQSAGIADAEMLKTFNCGIGLVLVVAPGARRRPRRGA